MPVVTLTNLTGSELAIPDLGFALAPGGFESFDLEGDLQDISRSESVVALQGAGSLRVDIDGTQVTTGVADALARIDDTGTGKVEFPVAIVGVAGWLRNDSGQLLVEDI